MNMTMEEACGYLKISMSTLRRRIRDGTIHTCKIGTRILIRKEHIDAVLDDSTKRRAQAAATV